MSTNRIATYLEPNFAKPRTQQHDTFALAQIRWLLRQDMPQVLDIESVSFPEPWDEADFLMVLRDPASIGMVAEAGTEIVGFCVYQMEPASIHVLNLAVKPSWRRRDVGTALVTRAIAKLQQFRRQRLVVEVSEKNLEAQKFLGACGLQAVEVLREHYPTGEDAYRFVYEIDQQGEMALAE